MTRLRQTPRPRRAAGFTATLIALAIGFERNSETRAQAPAPVDDAAVAIRAAKEAEAQAYQSKDEAAFRRAADALEAAVVASPDDVALRKSLGFILLERLDQPRRAVPQLERVVQLAPADTGWARILAKAHVRAGDRPRAIAVYETIVADDPQNVWDRLELGKLLAKEKRTAEARAALAKAYDVAPHDENVGLAYADFLKDSGDRAEAKRVVHDVLREHPRSAWGRGMLGDLYRAASDFTRARKAYGEAIEVDPGWYAAVTGLRELDNARRPKLVSAFYRFRDTDGFDQAGEFNTFTVGLADDLSVQTSLNVRWFSDAPVNTVHRLEEGVTLEYRPGAELTAQVGVTGFQVDGKGGEVGGHLLGAWKYNPFYVYADVRLNDPVNDSITTVRDAFTQDLLAGGAGWQVASRLSLSVVGSIAAYSDGNDRRYVNAEVAYRVLDDPLTHVRVQYEVFDYREPRPDYSSPQGYQIVRPLVDVRPKVAAWLWIDLRLEFPYVIDDSSWGTGVTVGPRVKIGEDVELTASYFRYDIPGSFTTYSGEGFKVGLSWRF